MAQDDAAGHLFLERPAKVLQEQDAVVVTLLVARAGPAQDPQEMTLELRFGHAFALAKELTVAARKAQRFADRQRS